MYHTVFSDHEIYFSLLIQYVYKYESVDPTYEHKMCHFLHSGTVSCYKKTLEFEQHHKR